MTDEDKKTAAEDKTESAADQPKEEQKPVEEDKKAESTETELAESKSEAEEKKAEPEPKAETKKEAEIDLSEIKPGSVVRVHQKIKEKNAKGEEKERIQVFEGTVLSRKHGSEPGATITVRKISEGIGVEKIFPLHSPNIAKIEVIKQFKVKRSKLFFLRNYKKRLKELKK